MQGELCLCSFPCIPPPGFLILGESQLLISTGELRQWPRGFLAHWAKRPCRSFVFFQSFDQLGPLKLGFLLSTSPSISKIDCAACFSHPLLSLNFQNMQTYSLHIANCSADCAKMTIQYHDKGRRPQALYELYIYLSILYNFQCCQGSRMAETLGWSSAGRCKPSIGTQSDHERGRWLDLWTAVLSTDVELQSKKHHWQGFMLFLVYIYSYINITVYSWHISF